MHGYNKSNISKPSFIIKHKKIWDSKHKPTSLALNEYKEAIKRYKLLRDEGMQEFRIWDEKDNIYIPETFRGVK